MNRLGSYVGFPMLVMCAWWLAKRTLLTPNRSHWFKIVFWTLIQYEWLKDSLQKILNKETVFSSGHLCCKYLRDISETQKCLSCLECFEKGLIFANRDLDVWFCVVSWLFHYRRHCDHSQLKTIFVSKSLRYICGRKSISLKALEPNLFSNTAYENGFLTNEL